MGKEPTSLARARKAMEEKVEYANVTNLRESLLPIVERLKNEPSVRYLIFKHGQPQAVLMSFQTYEFLKRAVDELLASARGISREDAIAAAIARLHAGPVPGEGERTAALAADSDEEGEAPATATMK